MNLPRALILLMSMLLGALFVYVVAVFVRAQI